MQHGCNTRRGKKLYLYYSDPSGYTKRLRFIMRLSPPLSLCLLPYLIFISSICVSIAPISHLYLALLLFVCLSLTLSLPPFLILITSLSISAPIPLFFSVCVLASLSLFLCLPLPLYISALALSTYLTVCLYLYVHVGARALCRRVRYACVPSREGCHFNF